MKTGRDNDRREEEVLAAGQRVKCECEWNWELKWKWLRPSQSTRSITHACTSTSSCTSGSCAYCAYASPAGTDTNTSEAMQVTADVLQPSGSTKLGSRTRSGQLLPQFSTRPGALLPSNKMSS
jgi:hypothetical protein